MPDRQVEALVRALVDHVAVSAAFPLVAVFDRPKTVAEGRDGVVTEWNPTFAGVALDLRPRRRKCAGYRLKRGSVRESRRMGESSFFQAAAFPRSCRSGAAAARLAHRANTVRRRVRPASPGWRIAEERARLRPLWIAPADSLRMPVVVRWAS